MDAWLWEVSWGIYRERIRSSITGCSEGIHKLDVSKEVFHDENDKALEHVPRGISKLSGQETFKTQLDKALSNLIRL